VNRAGFPFVPKKGEFKMKLEDIDVAVRLADPEKSPKVRAFADATIPLGADGVVKISGFSVIQTDTEAPHVAPPARKGSTRYFEVVSLIGKIRSLVDGAILAEYQRMLDEESER
jgi:hypothetical protein